MASRVEEQIIPRLSWERQMKAYQHALQHIMKDDFSKECADAIEKVT